VRADRLVSLALLLQTRGRMPARALAAALEVSVRTVYRDIAALNAAGVPVVTESGPNGGCWLVDGYRFPLRGLSGDEAAALLLLGVPAAVAELGLAEALAAAQRKVRAGAGVRPGASAEIASADPALVHLDMPRWFHGAEPVPHLRILAAAVRDGRLLRLGYRRGEQGPGTTRVVEPLGLVNKAGVWYLVASAAGREADDPAVFRAGRVTSAEALPGGVTRPGGFDLAAFWERWSASFAGSLPQVEVRVRASAAALAAFPEVFGDPVRPVLDAGGPPDAAGCREVTLTFEHEAAAVQRLAGFGGEIEVLSPATVRERLVATAHHLLERYGNDQQRSPAEGRAAGGDGSCCYHHRHL
jgi:predicted DNA-binding transcriptional regulator YafY